MAELGFTKKEEHKHKFTKTTTEKVRLYGRDNLPTTVIDVFTYKLCDCGYKTVLKMERTPKPPNPLEG